MFIGTLRDKKCFGYLRLAALVLSLLLAALASACSRSGANALAGKDATASARPELALQLGHGGELLTLAFSPDGKWFVSGGGDGMIKIWDARTGALKRTLNGHSLEVTSVVISPDGKRLASATGGVHWRDKSAPPASGEPVHELKLWEVETGKPLRTLTGFKKGISAIVFSPDGRTVAGGGDDKSVRFWNAETGEPERELKGASASITCLAFAPDGRSLAAGALDKQIRVWDAQTGALKQTLSGHENNVACVAFSPDGKMIASGDASSAAKLWEAGSGRLLATLLVLPAPDEYQISTEWLAFTPEGHYTGSEQSGKAINWRMGNELLPLERYAGSFRQPDLLQQAPRGGP
ncbi:MAG: WD40 repeat domain-containing protein [Blastocatellia bacterium]